MPIIKCPNNHYYDSSRDRECPYCAKLQQRPTNDGSENQMNELPTSYYDGDSFADPAQTQEGQLTESLDGSFNGFEKTIGIFRREDDENELTSGWLVCVQGPHRGVSFPLHLGRNFAGSSPFMDIPISGDNSISEEKHFSVVYEPKGNVFYLVPGNGQTNLNAKPLNESEDLKEGDVIEVGTHEFVFVPFCKEGRTWQQ